MPLFVCLTVRMSHREFWSILFDGAWSPLKVVVSHHNVRFWLKFLVLCYCSLQVTTRTRWTPHRSIREPVCCRNTFVMSRRSFRPCSPSRPWWCTWSSQQVSVLWLICQWNCNLKMLCIPFLKSWWRIKKKKHFVWIIWVAWREKKCG